MADDHLHPDWRTLAARQQAPLPVTNKHVCSLEAPVCVAVEKDQLCFIVLANLCSVSSSFFVFFF